MNNPQLHTGILLVSLGALAYFGVATLLGGSKPRPRPRPDTVAEPVDVNAEHNFDALAQISRSDAAAYHAAHLRSIERRK